MARNEAVRIAIVDNYPVALLGLQSLIRANRRFAVVGVFEDGLEALRAFRAAPPDLAIVDQTMPGLDGLDVLRVIQSEGLKTKAILLTGNANDGIIYEAVALGARGILFNDDQPELVLTCISEVAEGRQWLPEKAVSAIARETTRRDSARTVLEQLTERESQVARMVCEGLSNKEIAARLNLSEGTVKVHLNNIFRKSGLIRRSDLTKVLAAFEDRGSVLMEG